MRRLLLAALALAASCAAPPEEPAPGGEDVRWTVEATVDKRRVQVGEDLELVLTIRHPPGAEPVVATGANLAPFELIERIDEPTEAPTTTRLRLRIAAYRLPGEIAIPPIGVEYTDAKGEPRRIETEPIPIRLVTSLTADVTDIHDIKGPIADVAVPGRWAFLRWLLAALLVALAAFAAYRRLVRRGAVPPPGPAPPPLPPPDVEAERALRALAERRLLEQGRRGEHFTALAEIVKRYAGRRFGVPYLERTTREILEAVAAAGCPPAERTRLEAILDAADLVKFARVAPPDEDAQRFLPEAFRFVAATRPPRRPPVAAAMPPGESEPSRDGRLEPRR